MLTLQIVFTALAGGAFVALVFFAMRRPIPSDRSDVLASLEYGRALRTISLSIALAPITLLIVMLWRLHWRNEQMLIFAGVSFLAVDVFPVLLMLETTRKRIVLTNVGVTCYAAWGSPTSIAWSEIKSVKYSALNRWFILRAENGDVIRVSAHLAGIELFLTAARTKIPTERLGDILG